MAFPFWWMGAALAALFLVAAFTLFGVAMRLLVWTEDELRHSMLPGIVSGFRGWIGEATPGAGEPSPSPASSADAAVEDLVGADVPTARARRR